MNPDKQPMDYVPRAERIPEDRCDCIVAALLFAVAGLITGWLSCYLYMTI